MLHYDVIFKLHIFTSITNVSITSDFEQSHISARCSIRARASSESVNPIALRLRFACGVEYQDQSRRGVFIEENL